MPGVSWVAESDGKRVTWVAGNASVVSIPNYPGSPQIPAGSLISRFDYIGENFPKRDEIPDFSAVLSQLQANANEIAVLRNEVANLTGRISGFEENPLGVSSFAFDNTTRIFTLTLDTGEAFPTEPIEFGSTSNVFVGPNEPEEAYTLWFQTDPTTQKLVEIHVPDGSL